MGWTSYQNNNEERALEYYRVMLDTLEDRFRKAPVAPIYVAPELKKDVSLQVSPEHEAARIEKRVRAKRELDALCLIELLPGKRWRL